MPAEKECDLTFATTQPSNFIHLETPSRPLMLSGSAGW